MPISALFRRTRNVLLYILIMLGLIPNLYLVYHYICGDCLPILAQFNHIAHFVLLSGIIAGILSIVLRPKWQHVGWFLPSLFFFALWYGGHWLPKSTPDVEGIEITVATYNVQGNVSDPRPVIQTILDLDTDLIAMQELRGDLRTQMIHNLSTKYPFSVTDEVTIGTGLGLFSRFPILSSDIYITPYDPDDETPHPSYIRATIAFNNRPLVVYVFHASFPAYSLLTRYNDAANLHQHRAMAALVQRETLPVILLCDCNATPRSRPFAVLDSVLNNSFDQRGWGFGLTYPAHRPLIRIDHVWISPHFTTIDIKVWDHGGTSDHRPLWAILDLRD